MSGSGTFRYKLSPVPKGKHLFPHLHSQTEDTPWHHFLGGEFSPGAAQGQGPQLSLGRQGVQLRKKHFPKMKRSRRQISVQRRAGTFRTAVLRVWSVEPLMSLRPFPEIPEVKTTLTALLRYYLTSHCVDICFDVSLSSYGLW